MAVVDPGFPKVSANLLFGHFPRKLYDKSMKKFWPVGGGGGGRPLRRLIRHCMGTSPKKIMINLSQNKLIKHAKIN